MHSDLSILINDMSFDEYNERQLFELSPDRIEEKTSTAHQANHFLYNNDTWSPLKYEGAAIVSMLDNHPANLPLTNRLVAIQEELKNLLAPISSYYYLPKESFHQTIANTLSEERFEKHILEPGLEKSYPTLVAKTFDNIPSPHLGKPMEMKMTGLSVFGTAIGILGVFKHQNDYDEIAKFRLAFYEDYQMNQLGIRMTRQFVGHITLAYIESKLDVTEKNILAKAVNDINSSLKNEANYFYIGSAELRRYFHLAKFVKPNGYPAFHFLKH
jgi:hypothetical protein